MSSAASLAGSLELTLDWDGERVRDVGIVSTRPFAALRLLRDKTREAALGVVGSLYSVCAGAQRIAAITAWDAAEQRAASAAQRQARECVLVIEAIQEHLWRILLDVPAQLGIAPRADLIAPLRKALAELSRQIAAGEMSGARPGCATTAAAVQSLRRLIREDIGIDCAARDAARGGFVTALPQSLAARVLDALRDERWGALAGPFLPEFSASEVVETLLPALARDAGFERAPHWRGVPCETGALARQSALAQVRVVLDENAVFVRILARMIELARLARRLETLLRGGDVSASEREPGWVRGVSTGAGLGTAWVQTARGLLMHVVEVDRGTVSRYMIVAPTEWNFHPRGAFSVACTGMQVGSETELRRRAALLALSLDPCVPYTIEVGRA